MLLQDFKTTTTQQQQHPFHGLFSKTTWVSRYQEHRTILDFNRARDDGVTVASTVPYAYHLNFASHR